MTEPVQGWRDYVWELKSRAEQAEKRVQEMEMRIAAYLRHEAAEIMGNALAGKGHDDRCEAAATALELAAEDIETGRY